MVKEGKGNFIKYLLLMRYLHLLKTDIYIHFTHEETEPALEFRTLVWLSIHF